MTIPFHVPYMSGGEERNLHRALSEAYFGLRGQYATEVTKALEAITGHRGRVLLTHSCTGALELMALAMRLGPGDQVIAPSYTFSSTASAFIRAGAEVVFADINEQTMGLDPQSVEDRLSERTRAVVAVHYAGLPAALAGIREVLADHPALLLEDAAQAIGVVTQDGALGAVGTMGAFSFHFTKNIHCGFGGALVVRDPIDFERTEHLWERGTNRAKLLRGEIDRYTWVEVGSSFSMDEMHAAFLAAQIGSLPSVIEERETIFNVYRDRIAEIREKTGLISLLEPDDYVDRWNFHATVIILKTAALAEEVRTSLLEQDIQAYIGYVPLHSSPVGLSFGNRSDDLPVTEALAPRVLRLPIHTSMTISDAERVVDVMGSAISGWTETS